MSRNVCSFHGHARTIADSADRLCDTARALARVGMRDIAEEIAYEIAQLRAIHKDMLELVGEVVSQDMVNASESQNALFQAIIKGVIRAPETKASESE